MRNAAVLAVLTLCSLAGCAGAPSASVPPAAGAGQAMRARSSGAPVISFEGKGAGPAVSADVYGASLDTWYDFRSPWVDPSLAQTGIHLVRFPGGSESDAYHWENGGTLCASMGYVQPGATFDHLMQHVAARVGNDTAITLNYGSNPQCNGGGDPSEAGAWVAHAKSEGYHVPFWTVGNEVYGSWEYDLHARPHDPHVYAQAFRTGYYPAVKGADRSVKLGVVGDFDQPEYRAWNDVVFRDSGPFDFVEIHYYPQYDTDSDSFLLGPAVSQFAAKLAQVRAEMTADGLSKSLPIYLGEFNNDAGNQGKQSVSIVNGLYLGQMLGVLTQAGVPMATWWVAYGSCDQNGDFAHSLYGWQNFGSYGLFSDGLPNPNEGCATTPKIPGGTPFPTGRVMALYRAAVPPGSTVRTVSVPSSLGTQVRAYGYKTATGYTAMLFNNTLDPVSVDVLLRDAGNSFTATLTTYGKAQYDLTKEHRWIGPVTQSLGRVSSSIPLSLPPYSLTALSLK